MNKDVIIDRIDQNLHILHSLVGNVENPAAHVLIENMHRDIHDLAAMLSANEEIVSSFRRLNNSETP